MLDPTVRKQAAGSMFVKSAELVANMAAAIAAFLTTPLAYSHSVDWVRGYAVQHYGANIGGLAAFAWWLCLAVLIFGLSRMTLATAIMAGSLALATRLFFA